MKFVATFKTNEGIDKTFEIGENIGLDDAYRVVANNHLTTQSIEINPNMDYARKIHLGGDMSKHLAPNGKPSNLNHEQWHMVRSQEFKNWFGDWENDPKNASKLVDENGEPLIVYHGSNKHFNTFNFKIGKGIYSSFSSFTENKNLSESYGIINYSVFLKIQNPYIVNGGGQYIWKVIDKKNSPDSFFDEDVPKFYDGIIFKDVIDFNGELGSKYVLDVSNVYMVRNNTQIKLADGSNTTFDGSNPDIRFELGGEMSKNTTLSIYEVIADTDSWSERLYKGSDYEKAMKKLSNAGIEEVSETRGGRIILEKKDNIYKFIGDLADYEDLEDYPIDDYYEDEDYFELIKEGDWETIEIKEIDPINKKSEETLHEIEKYYKGKYGNWKYNTIEVNDKNGNYVGCIQLRIANHSQNIYNVRTKTSCEYSISIVIADKDYTKNKFKVLSKKQSEVEEYFDSSQKAIDIINEIDMLILDGITYFLDNKIYKRGGRTIAQTPAPKKDRVYGSKTNPKGSAKDKTEAKAIKFSPILLKSIKNKIDAHNSKYPTKKVNLATAKAVVRRGMGAYSKSHRPTISGGAPNSRQAWGIARLNKFLLKKAGYRVKRAYVQDDDLL